MRQANIDVRHLRSALEFAVKIAEEGQKARPPVKYPSALKRYFRAKRIPNASLNSIRRIVDGDDEFRELVASGIVAELVDPIGRIWLERGDGWQDRLADAVAEAETANVEADLRGELQRADRRREAAERAAARAHAELLAANETIEERDRRIVELDADVAKLATELDEVRAELVDVRNDVRHARDRERAAAEKLRAAESAKQAAERARGSAESIRDEALADRANVAAERSDLAQLAASAEALAARLSALTAAEDERPARVVRRALPMPGGILGSSRDAAEYLLRSGATVLVDGYNVAKPAWPKLDLAGQRVVLLDHVENIARRYGCDLTVVFDGAEVTGASADTRRIVRVMYSPADVTADDVIRDEVARLPVTRPVVVITNDKEILRDVRANGANLMSSNQLIDLFV